MATKIIGPNAGADYATPALWFAYLSGLGSLSEDETGALQKAEISVTAAQSLSGVTTNGHRITLTAAAGNSFVDHASAATNPLVYDATKGAAIKKTSGSPHTFDIQQENFSLTRLQIKKASNYNGAVTMAGSHSGREIDQCILQMDNATSSGRNLISVDVEVSNTLILSQAFSHGVMATAGSLENCTIANTGGGSTIGVQSQGTPAVTVINTVVYGFSTDYSITGNAACTNNATDKSSFGAANYGTNGQTAIVGADEFESVTNGSEDFRLKSTATKLKDNGTNTDTPATDIIGQAISNTTRDIGAWELQQGGGSSSAVGSASGDGTASGVGASVAASIGSASGTGAASGIGASAAAAAGSASGSATVSGVGQALTGSVGSAAGTSTVSGVGASVAASAGSAAGSATISGVGSSASAGAAIGTAAGTSTVSGIGASIAAAIGSATGSATVSGVTNGVVEAPRMIGGGWRQPGSRRRKFPINGEVVEAFDDEIALIYAAYGLLELEEQQGRPKKKKKAKAKKAFPYKPGELLTDALPTNTAILADAVILAEQRLKATQAGRLKLAEIEAQRAQRLLEEEEEWMLLVA